MRYLASWGIIVVAPNTHRSLFSSHQGLALDLSRALRMVAYGELGGGRVRGDLRRLGVLGHSIGGGAAMLAAAKDDQIRAVVTVTAAETKPSAVEAAGQVYVPSLHLIGAKDDLAESDGAESRSPGAGPAQLRWVKGSGHLGLAEGKQLRNNYPRRRLGQEGSARNPDPGVGVLHPAPDRRAAAGRPDGEQGRGHQAAGPRRPGPIRCSGRRVNSSRQPSWAAEPPRPAAPRPS